MTDKKQVHLYTDGSCDTGSRRGGWAYLLVYNGVRQQAAGFEADTTNNRMELSAAVKGLERLKEGCFVTLTTDSQYLRRAFTDGWLTTWQRNGWRTAAKTPVKNKDLWLELLALADVHELSWAWIKGHAGHTENELVDALALKARKTGKSVEEVV
ncbi:ribonuclease HI [soil metagenome]